MLSGPRLSRLAMLTGLRPISPWPAVFVRGTSPRTPHDLG
jgi:hypothetical protein